MSDWAVTRRSCRHFFPGRAPVAQLAARCSSDNAPAKRSHAMTSVGAVIHPFADRALSQRFERAEGSANRSFVEARCRLNPDGGSAWIECGGALAMFDGAA